MPVEFVTPTKSIDESTDEHKRLSTINESLSFRPLKDKGRYE